MRIQLNSHKNIVVGAEVTQFVEQKVNRGLKRFTGRLTRVHLLLTIF